MDPPYDPLDWSIERQAAVQSPSATPPVKTNSADSISEEDLNISTLFKTFDDSDLNVSLTSYEQNMEQNPIELTDLGSLDLDEDQTLEHSSGAYSATPNAVEEEIPYQQNYNQIVTASTEEYVPMASDYPITPVQPIIENQHHNYSQMAESSDILDISHNYPTNSTLLPSSGNHYLMESGNPITSTQTTISNPQVAHSEIPVFDDVYYHTNSTNIAASPSPSTVTSGYSSEGFDSSTETSNQDNAQIYYPVPIIPPQQSNSAQPSFQLKFCGMSLQSEQPIVKLEVKFSEPAIQEPQPGPSGIQQRPKDTNDSEEPKRGRKRLYRPPVTDFEFHCVPCQKVFQCPRGQSQHNVYAHSGPRDFQCVACGKKFRTEADLEEHQGHHDDANKPHGCPACSSRYQNRSDLDRHYRERHGEPPMRCQYCNKGFVRPGHFRTHLRSHMNGTAHVKRQKVD